MHQQNTFTDDTEMEQFYQDNIDSLGPFVQLVEQIVGTDIIGDALPNLATACGDSQLDPGEQCDHGGESATCDDDCSFVFCGDNNINETSGEGCEDGNYTPEDGCSAECKLEFCGDGIIQVGLDEECDNGPSNSDSAPDACRTTCIPAACGDGVVDSAESCDEGVANSESPDATCRTDCDLAGCGDGVQDTVEECDDNNNIDLDFCSSSCLIENIILITVTNGSTATELWAITTRYETPGFESEKVKLTDAGSNAFTGALQLVDDSTVNVILYDDSWTWPIRWGGVIRDTVAVATHNYSSTTGDDYFSPCLGFNLIDSGP